MVGQHLSMSEKVHIARTRTRLFSWFHLNGRDLPWRHEGASIYQKICVEVLLQRTRVETVARIYGPFFARFPSWAAIAGTPRSELEQYLKPIGLWQRRASSLQGLASYAAARDGVFPSEPSAHSQIPRGGPIPVVRDIALSAQAAKTAIRC